jgi:hypothetical protein
MEIEASDESKRLIKRCHNSISPLHSKLTQDEEMEKRFQVSSQTRHTFISQLERFHLKLK